MLKRFQRIHPLGRAPRKGRVRRVCVPKLLIGIGRMIRPCPPYLYRLLKPDTVPSGARIYHARPSSAALTPVHSHEGILSVSIEPLIPPPGGRRLSTRPSAPFGSVRFNGAHYRLNFRTAQYTKQRSPRITAPRIVLTPINKGQNQSDEISKGERTSTIHMAYVRVIRVHIEIVLYGFAGEWR